MITMRPIGTVVSERTELTSKGWADVKARIELDTARFGSDALLGLDAFSHLEVVMHLHLIAPSEVETGARPARARDDLPRFGVFARRSPRHPNRIALSRCKIVRVDDTSVVVRGLDAIDGTPVLDIKPWMTPFAPRGQVQEPAWVHELLHDYF